MYIHGYPKVKQMAANAMEAIFKSLFDVKPDCNNLEVCMPAPSHEKMVKI